jgi:carboxylesterase
MSKDIVLPGGEHGVLLLHGLRGSPLEMQHLGKQLQKAGFSVRIPYIHGCGFGSKADAGSSRWEDWVEQARAHYAALGESCTRVALGGLCIGAVLALALAADRGIRASAVMPLATTLKWDGWGMPWYRIFAPLAYYTPLRFLYSFPERWPFGLKDQKLRDWVARQMRETGSSIAGKRALGNGADRLARQASGHPGGQLPHRHHGPRKGAGSARMHQFPARSRSRRILMCRYVNAGTLAGGTWRGPCSSTSSVLFPG